MAMSADWHDASRSRVAHKTDSYSRPHLLCIGGKDHHLRIPMLLALRDKGFRVSAAGGADPAPFARSGVSYQRFQFARFVDPLSDWNALRTLVRIIAEQRPNLVQCFDTKMNVLVPFAARHQPGVRVISTINGLGWLYSSRSPLALALRPIYRVLQWAANRYTDVSVFQNADDLEFFKRHRLLGKSRDVLIPGSGIDIDGFEQAGLKGPSPAELRDRLGLGHLKVVLSVTRVTRQKGIPTLLRAAALVHKHRPDVRFVLVGPREQEGALAVTQAEIDQHRPYVLAVGPRNDVPALLRMADVFAFPTELREGIPRVLLEAAAAGLPIVTTRMPGCTDVIRDGWNGFLVPPRSPDQLAEKILNLLDARRNAEAMGARAATFIKKEFDLGLVVARYAGIYHNLLGRTHASFEVNLGRAGSAPGSLDTTPHGFGG
jgi:glycosyltransferase involved in cell wall biosynthesis